MKQDDYLQLSGLQHFAFCRRQWALIHIEQQWADNLRTVEGEIQHSHAHDENAREKRGELLIIRGLRVFSARLAISGSCDVVEFRRSENGAVLQGENGKWLPCPVEYKHGSAKLQSDADRLQLCAQAICLEEMLGCDIPQGALFYWETRHRELVPFTHELRDTVNNMVQEMHDYFSRGHTPKVKPGKHCNACSLKNVCLPVLCKKLSVAEYLQTMLREDKP